jgi:hypothetical protein
VGQVRARRSVDSKYLVICGIALIVIAAAICFFFLLEAIGSHGSDRGLFIMKCLFALITIVGYPLLDLILFRNSKLTDSARNRNIRYSAILSRVLLIAVAAFLLIRIIGPPLNMALRLQYRSAAKALINWGADVHKTDRYGCAPLWYAVHRVDADMTTFLLERGAILDSRFAGLGLIRAVETNNTDMLRLLLGRGADPNSIYMGATPLIYACQQRNVGMIRILLDGGADTNLRGSYPNVPWDGKSALDIAYEVGDEQAVAVLLSHAKKQ